MPIKHDRECEVCQKQFDTRAKLANMWRNDVFVVRIVLEWCCSFFPCACQPGHAHEECPSVQCRVSESQRYCVPERPLRPPDHEVRADARGIGDGAKRHVLRMLDLQEGVQ